ncbi:MAG: dihydropteroate synthase [Candidatus Aminicenantes bacterium]|nr:dihydropteroate synthase [Candidatus Aminicenantes bacterium]NLH76713.1 dihydropteroate synthase [Acidobacteriota bacterium]
MSRETRRLDIGGRRLELGDRAWLMGIVNVTPDSFADGGRYADPARAVERGLALVAEGADIVDVGGESTRPGSLPVPEAEETARVVPVVAGLRRESRALISVDTAKAAVARAALDAGADIVNDISAFRFDPAMAGVVARSGAAAVLMHMKGTPATMQDDPRYDDLVGEIAAFLDDRLRVAEAAGVPRERLVVDPGIGFGKTVDHNLEILRRAADFHALGRPLLLGFSRKAFLGRVLGGLPPEERLEATLAAAVLAVERGAHILRVHDVGPVFRAVRAAEAVLAGGPAGPAPAEGRAGHVR